MIVLPEVYPGARIDVSDHLVLLAVERLEPSPLVEQNPDMRESADRMVIAVVPVVMPAEAPNEALIGEPVQGLAGAVDPPEGFWQAAARACMEAGAFFIMDEVQTGVARLGAFTGSLKFGVEPDMTTLAKGLGSGFPISALLVSDAIAAEVRPGQLGTTFGGGPMACAAAMATLELVFEKKLDENAAACERFIRARLAGVRGVAKISGTGLLLGIILDRKAAPVVRKLRDRGILVGSSLNPCGIRLTPPLIVSQNELEHFCGELESILEDNNET